MAPRGAGRDMTQSWLAKKCPCVWSTLSGTTFISEACFSFKTTDLYLGLKVTLDSEVQEASPCTHPGWARLGGQGMLCAGRGLGSQWGALPLESSV